MIPRSPENVSWTAYECSGGGSFAGEVCTLLRGLAIRDLLCKSGKGFKTEFNLETKTYQFYSVCNDGILSRFVRNHTRYLFPVSTAFGEPRCFGFLTVSHYAEMVLPTYLKECLACSGERTHGSRTVLRLDRIRLVQASDAFPLYREQEWQKLKSTMPVQSKKRIYNADCTQAEALSRFLSSRPDMTSQYLACTLEQKRALKQQYDCVVRETRCREEHARHLRGLWEETDYFEHV